MKKAALISVSNKDGILEFAKGLSDLGYTLLTTKGSGTYLRENGLAVLSIEEYTGQKEILDGRVKTLHPKIHAGLLADRTKEQHVAELNQQDIFAIEVAAINLYPFIENLGSAAAKDPLQMIELVDIGGPTMLRAAAKNFRSISAVIDPADYPAVLNSLQTGDGTSAQALEQRRALSVKVFKELAHYNLEIARYFSEASFLDDQEPTIESPESDARYLSTVSGVVLEKQQELRYGENPHQKGRFYAVVGEKTSFWKQHQGKELSYNNFLDFDAAARIAASLPTDAKGVAIIKHLNPCGAAFGANLCDALTRAKQGDPRSHFGGVIALNAEVELATAQAIIEDFTEIVVAPSYTPEALECFKKRKNIRIMAVDFAAMPSVEMRSLAGGFLVQEVDSGVSAVEELEVVSGDALTEEERRDLQFAWTLTSHVKSNAVAVVKGAMLLAAGAGQMSRIDSVEVAIQKMKLHGHDPKGAVCASDAFFPFSDCIEMLHEQGVSVIVAPKGAKRDEDNIKVAESLGVKLVFAPDRHFRH